MRSMPSSLAWVGGALYLLGLVPITWSFLVNPHLESTVRIQNDRGHLLLDDVQRFFHGHLGRRGNLERQRSLAIDAANIRRAGCPGDFRQFTHRENISGRGGYRKRAKLFW